METRAGGLQGLDQRKRERYEAVLYSPYQSHLKLHRLQIHTRRKREDKRDSGEEKIKKGSQSAQRHLRNLARCLSRSLLQLRGRLLRYPSSVSILRTASNGVHSILVVFFSGCWAVVTGQVGWSNVIMSGWVKLLGLDAFVLRSVSKPPNL